MLLQQIFLQLKDKYSISKNEIEDLFDIEEGIKDCAIYDNICVRYDSVLKIKFESMYFEAKSKKNKLHTFLKIIMWKKAINSDIENDLFMNKLSDFKNKFVISILEKNTIYKFRISDIVNLWVLALTHTDQLFVDPINLKNPYTNIEFSKSALYNIYFKLINCGFIVPNLITSHIKYNLDTKMFTIRNYPELKEIAILTFMREGSYLEKYEQIVNMLHDFRRDIKYYTMSTTCTTSVKIRVTKVFSNYLFLYLESKYSCNPLIKDESEKRVKEKLSKFADEEPYFGFNRGDVIRYVPLGERAEQRRRERDARLSPTPPPGLTPPPVPSSTLRRRRRNAITSLPMRRPTLPPPPPPINTIVRTYSPPPPPPLPNTSESRTELPSLSSLPPLRINNYTSDITVPDFSSQINENNESSSNTEQYISSLFRTRTRARDILQQMEDEINLNRQENTSTSILYDDDEEDIDDDEEDEDIDDEFGNEFSIEIALDIENPFAPNRELNRTPPPLRESLLRPITEVSTTNMLERINEVINNVLEERDNQNNITNEEQNTENIEDLNTENNEDFNTENNEDFNTENNEDFNTETDEF